VGNGGCVGEGRGEWGVQTCENELVLYIFGGYSLICTQLILVFEDFLVELDIW
jgi:hypothetical protein